MGVQIWYHEVSKGHYWHDEPALKNSRWLSLLETEKTEAVHKETHQGGWRQCNTNKHQPKTNMMDLHQREHDAIFFREHASFHYQGKRDVHVDMIPRKVQQTWWTCIWENMMQFFFLKGSGMQTISLCKIDFYRYSHHMALMQSRILKILHMNSP